MEDSSLRFTVRNSACQRAFPCKPARSPTRRAPSSKSPESPRKASDLSPKAVPKESVGRLRCAAVNDVIAELNLGSACASLRRALICSNNAVSAGALMVSLWRIDTVRALLFSWPPVTIPRFGNRMVGGAHETSPRWLDRAEP